jgi:hypothetical protein
MPPCSLPNRGAAFCWDYFFGVGVGKRLLPSPIWLAGGGVMVMPLFHALKSTVASEVICEFEPGAGVAVVVPAVPPVRPARLPTLALNVTVNLAGK